MKIRNNKIDWVMEGLCIVMLAGLGLYLAIGWANLPDQIPAHYDALGNIDRWGNKGEILIVPIMALLLYLMITVLEQFPSIWNTGVKVTVTNQYHVYRTLRYMIKSLKLLVVADFTYLTINSMLAKPLPGAFTVIVLVLVFGDLIFWIVRLGKVK